MLFSQREGIKPLKKEIQLNSMDNDLKNGLWDALVVYYFPPHEIYYEHKFLIVELWHNYFKWPIDTIGDYESKTRKEIRKYFFDCAWYEVYDFIEFIVNKYPDNNVNKNFMKFCNDILERELSAYRFVGGKIVRITSKMEISEIDETLEKSKSLNLNTVHTHLKQALNLLADRKSPDYRNSIKESISAVEAICRVITKDEKATLGQALEKLAKENKIDLHSALKKAFIKLYGYSSDAEGIRHALSNKSNLGYEDARFMLVVCSAFVNYLISKTYSVP